MRAAGGELQATGARRACLGRSGYVTASSKKAASTFTLPNKHLLTLDFDVHSSSGSSAGNHELIVHRHGAHKAAQDAFLTAPKTIGSSGP